LKCKEKEASALFDAGEISGVCFFMEVPAGIHRLSHSSAPKKTWASPRFGIV